MTPIDTTDSETRMNVALIELQAASLEAQKGILPRNAKTAIACAVDALMASAERLRALEIEIAALKGAAL